MNSMLLTMLKTIAGAYQEPTRKFQDFSKMKIEACWWLISLGYTFKVVNTPDVRKIKGVKRLVVQKKITYDDMYKCWFDGIVVRTYYNQKSKTRADNWETEKGCSTTWGYQEMSSSRVNWYSTVGTLQNCKKQIKKLLYVSIKKNGKKKFAFLFYDFTFINPAIVIRIKTRPFNSCFISTRRNYLFYQMSGYFTLESYSL